MTRAEKKKELVKLFLTMGFSLSEVIDEAMNFQIDKACDWLHENVCNVYNYHGDEITVGFVEQFKKAMQ